MSNKVENPQAFPFSIPQDPADFEYGMTLRDYFAAKAMQGVIATGRNTDWQGIAEFAYDIADSMLKERQKK